MIPAAFDYEVADSAAHALSLLAEHGEDAKLLAGGHSLLPMMKVRLAQPAVLDRHRPGRRAVRHQESTATSWSSARPPARGRWPGSDLVRAEVPMLAYAAAQVGDPQIRHRGTIGGSLAHADPSADLPMTLLALGGSVEITGPAGVRAVGADDFFVGPFESALGTRRAAVRGPRAARRLRSPWGYQKFVRRANDWAIVGVAAYGGRVALASMGGTPLRALADRGGAAVAARPSTEAAAARGRGHLARLRLPRRHGLPRAPGPRPHQARPEGKAGEDRRCSGRTSSAEPASEEPRPRAGSALRPAWLAFDLRDRRGGHRLLLRPHAAAAALRRGGGAVQGGARAS